MADHRSKAQGKAKMAKLDKAMALITSANTPLAVASPIPEGQGDTFPMHWGDRSILQRRMGCIILLEKSTGPRR